MVNIELLKPWYCLFLVIRVQDMHRVSFNLDSMPLTPIKLKEDHLRNDLEVHQAKSAADARSDGILARLAVRTSPASDAVRQLSLKAVSLSGHTAVGR
jgi:hypothetical protein